MIPQTFVDRYLWSPSQTPSTGTTDTSSLNEESLPPTFQFSEGVLEELDALTALAFSEAEKTHSIDTPITDIPFEKCLVFSCPTLEGACIIDDAVRRVATTHEADVVVLDALELAMGRCGLLGIEAGRILEDMYPSVAIGSTVIGMDPTEGENVGDEGPSTPDEPARRLVDALLNIQSGNLSSTTATGQPPPKSRPSRRIIYFRDFQYIVDVARPLLAYVLRALYESRCVDEIDRAASSESASEPASEESSSSTIQSNVTVPERTTVLLFGSTTDSEALHIGSQPFSTQQNCMLLNCLFTHTRTSVMHHRASPCSCLVCCSWLSASPTSYLEPVAIKDAQLTDAEWGSFKLDALGSEKLAVSVFAKNVKSWTTDSDWQKRMKLEKIKRLNEALLRVCLEREGFTLEDGALDGTLLQSSQKGDESLLDINDAFTIVKIMKGLMARGSSPPAKVANLVSEAYGILERRIKERQDWDDGTSTPESDQSNGKIPMKDTYEDVSTYAKALLGCIIDTEDMSTTFEDVCVDESIVDSLKTIVTLPLLYPNYFNSGVLAKEAIGGILLYGPPGTGKTMLCRALAKASHAKMLRIKPSDIYNMWVGESEKTVAAVFELAHRLAPCIVFIDEIDSLFSSRTDCTKTWERNVLTEFMQNMDGLRSSKKNRENNIVIVGATNRPFDLDLAILRRLPRRILVDMPGLEMRKRILESYLRDETLHDDVDLDKLATEAEGFSGSDLKNLCVAAAVASVKEAIGSGWRNTEKASNSQGSSKDSEDSSGSIEVAEELPTRMITPSNITQARNEINRSVGGKSVSREPLVIHRIEQN
ncbi:hypothetical protein H1R20_g11055, partial [Candolleomyces eurysporus]